MTPGSSNSGSGERTPPRGKYRLLLDQGFPNPPGFDVEKVDAGVKATHLYAFDRDLSEQSTPDWYLYVVASLAGFNAFVTRDISQVKQLEEMWVLSRVNLTVITFRQGINDPIAEWGQLLAYLPRIRKHDSNGKSQIIRLPKPTLGTDRFESPNQYLAEMSTSDGISRQELNRRAEMNVNDYFATQADPDDSVVQHLGLTP